MKTRLKKLFVLPLLCLTLMTTMVKADVFQEEVTYFCTIDVISATGGIISVIGAGTNCEPAFNWWCSPKKCTVLLAPVR